MTAGKGSASASPMPFWSIAWDFTLAAKASS